MILNAYAVLDGLVCLLRLPLSLLAIGLAIGLLRTSSNGATASISLEPYARENRSYLLVTVAVVLLVLNVLAWPLFYLLLQSYVPQWKGVMCIYGVTQIGAGSLSISRFLPGLLTTIQILKPTVVFLSGAWLVVYLANRRTPSSALLSRTSTLLLLFGLVSASDSLFEGAYLLIPKAEQFLDSGCCTEAIHSSAEVSGLLPEMRGGGWFVLIYCAVNGLMACSLQAQHGHAAVRWLPALLVGAIVSVPLNLLFLIDFAAPTVLGLPYHHCAYDLLSKVPETGIGVCFWLLGAFSVGWASIVAWLGRHEHTRAFLHQSIGRLLYMASIGYLASMIFFSVQLVLR